jgi:hypothetical protein
VSNICKIAALAGLVYGIYSVATYSGPYQWAAEWQMKHFGEYDIELTALGVILIPLIIPFVFMAIYMKGRPAPISDAVMDRMSLGATAPTGGEGSKAALICVVLGFLGIFVAAGAYRLGNNKSKQALTFEPIALAGHAMPRTRHIELKGWVRTDMTVEFTEDNNGSKTVTSYMPVTARDWKETDPLIFFLRPNGNVLIANNQSYNIGPNAEPFEVKLPGVLFRNDLPGPVRAQYEKHSLKLASPYMVLDTNTKAELDIYWEVTALAAITGVVVLLVGGLMAYRNWKEAHG